MNISDRGCGLSSHLGRIEYDLGFYRDKCEVDERAGHEVEKCK